jgi:hypothetical protein
VLKQYSTGAKLKETFITHTLALTKKTFKLGTKDKDPVRWMVSGWLILADADLCERKTLLNGWLIRSSEQGEK